MQPHGLQHAGLPCPLPTPRAYFFKLMSIKSVMPSNHLILCHPLLLLPSIFPNIRVFPNESVLRIRWPKYWNFSFSISPSNENSGLISFRTDFLREMKYPQIKFEIIKCNATKYLQPTELFWLESRTFKYKSSPYF